MNSYILLGQLQRFIERRGVVLDMLTVSSMVTLMIDWYQQGPVSIADQKYAQDTLVYRYGGWSEGCVTAFKLSLLRKVGDTQLHVGVTNWFAGITILYDPARYSNMDAFSIVLSDNPSVATFRASIESSSAYIASATAKSMGAMLESGGMREESK